MQEAWKAVKRNRGAAGIDRISIDLYSLHAGTNLDSLAKELKSRSYKPRPLKRVYIPKGKGKMRPLGIPTVQCRIAQEVVRRLINPIFEKKFQIKTLIHKKEGCRFLNLVFTRTNEIKIAPNTSNI